MMYRNRSKIYKKGQVFVNRKTGRLVKIINYYPQTANSPEKVLFVNIDHLTNKEQGQGECFGNIQNYLYNINSELNQHLPPEDDK